MARFSRSWRQDGRRRSVPEDISMLFMTEPARAFARGLSDLVLAPPSSPTGSAHTPKALGRSRGAGRRCGPGCDEGPPSRSHLHSSDLTSRLTNLQVRPTGLSRPGREADLGNRNKPQRNRNGCPPDCAPITRGSAGFVRRGEELSASPIPSQRRWHCPCSPPRPSARQRDPRRGEGS